MGLDVADSKFEAVPLAERARQGSLKNRYMLLPAVHATCFGLGGSDGSFGTVVLV